MTLDIDNICRIVNRLINGGAAAEEEKYGFVLLIAEFNTTTVHVISNVQPDSALDVMRDYVDNADVHPREIVPRETGDVQ